MNTEGKIAYVAITSGGVALAKKLQGLLKTGDLYTSEKLQSNEVKCICGHLRDFMGELFRSYDYLICIMATGIVVRSIAPYIVSKFKDPAVIVLDERGQNVISLLSGHMGGANEMTLKLSKLIMAHPVITTATDIHEVAALDQIAKHLDAYIEDFRETVKKVNYALVHSKRVGLYIEGDYEIDERGFTRLDKLEEALQKTKLEEMEFVVYITHKNKIKFTHPGLIKVVPGCYVLGVGCKKNTAPEYMLERFKMYLERHGIDAYAIAKVGSIEIKKEELAIQTLATQLNRPFEVFSKEDILEVEGLFESSDFVRKTIGVGAVAEPVAYLLGSKRVILPKEKHGGITFALGESRIGEKK